MKRRDRMTPWKRQSGDYGFFLKPSERERGKKQEKRASLALVKRQLKLAEEAGAARTVRELRLELQMRGKAVPSGKIAKRCKRIKRSEENGPLIPLHFNTNGKRAVERKRAVKR